MAFFHWFSYHYGALSQKRKTRRKSCLSFLMFRYPGGRLHTSAFNRLGASELPLRQGLAWDKTLVRRKSAVGQKAGRVAYLPLPYDFNISILTVLCSVTLNPIRFGFSVIFMFNCSTISMVSFLVIIGIVSLLKTILLKYF